MSNEKNDEIFVDSPTILEIEGEEQVLTESSEADRIASDDELDEFGENSPELESAEVPQESVENSRPKSDNVASGRTEPSIENVTVKSVNAKRDSDLRLSGAKIKSAKDFFERGIPLKTDGSMDRLQKLIPGKIYISFSDLKQSYSFQWIEGKEKVENSLPFIVPDVAPADCRLVLNDRTFMAVYEGNLNPQVAMLTNKIAVEGNSSLAVYFFNLVAPRPRM